MDLKVYHLHKIFDKVLTKSTQSTMGYFDGLTDAIFKKDVQGRDLFFPYGILGSGYVLTSEEQKNKIRKFIKIMYIVMLPGIYVAAMLIGFWIAIVILPIYYVWYYFMMKKMMTGLNKSEEKLKVSESYKNSARSHNLWVLIVLELFTFVFVIAGIFIIFSTANLWFGVLTILFFGFCSAAIGYMIVSKIKTKKT